jgi:hypothetical protein
LITPNADKDVDNRNSGSLLIRISSDTKFWKTDWQFLITLTIFLLYDTAVAHLGVYTSELKTYIHIKTHIQIVVAILFITAKTWK